MAGRLLLTQSGRSLNLNKCSRIIPTLKRRRYRQRLISPSRAQRGDDPFGGQRRFCEMHTKRRQRVLNRRNDCGWSWDCTALTGTLDAERIEWVRRFQMCDSATRHISRYWQQVIDERCREGLRVLVI